MEKGAQHTTPVQVDKELDGNGAVRDESSSGSSTESGSSGSSTEGYQRGLGSRQIQMIAIGGAIGTGLFLGAGKAIAMAGPSHWVGYRVTNKSRSGTHSPSGV